MGGWVDPSRIVLVRMSDAWYREELEPRSLGIETARKLYLGSTALSPLKTKEWWEWGGSRTWDGS